MPNELNKVEPQTITDVLSACLSDQYGIGIKGKVRRNEKSNKGNID